MYNINCLSVPSTALRAITLLSVSQIYPKQRIRLFQSRNQSTDESIFLNEKKDHQIPTNTGVRQSITFPGSPGPTTIQALWSEPTKREESARGIKQKTSYPKLQRHSTRKAWTNIRPTQRAIATTQNVESKRKRDRFIPVRRSLYSNIFEISLPSLLLPFRSLLLPPRSRGRRGTNQKPTRWSKWEVRSTYRRALTLKIRRSHKLFQFTLHPCKIINLIYILYHYLFMYILPWSENSFFCMIWADW